MKQGVQAVNLTSNGIEALTILIVNYESFELLLRCLESLMLNSGALKPSIIVVDNASATDHGTEIAKRYPGVIWLRMPVNLGFAAATNLAARRVETEWILLLNPDTEVQKGALERLLYFSQSRRTAGITGGRTRYGDGTLNPYSCGARPTLWSVFCRSLGLARLFRSSAFFNSEALGGWQRDSIRHVDYVVGCFLMISTQLWKQLSGFDERYYLFGEEVDLCLRARRLGYQPMITPQAEIIHHVGGSITPGLERSVFLAKARSTLIRSHWSPASARIGILLLWLGAGLRAFLSGLHFNLDSPSRLEKRELWRRRHEWISGY